MVQKSSSLWGCELKSSMMEEKQLIVRHPPCEDVSWKIPGIQQVLIDLVILLVRMWVEKLDLEAKEGGDRSSSMWGCELKREWCKNVWYSSIALFMRKIVPSNDMNSIYVMRKRGELKEYKLQFLSIKKGLHYLGGVQPWGKSYEKDLKCLFSWTIPSIELNCDKTVMELGRNC